MSSGTSVTETPGQTPHRPDGTLIGGIARLCAKRPVSAALALYAVGTDGLVSWHGMGFLGRGIVDEPAHLATALVVLGTIVRLRRGSVPGPWFCWPMLASSVLIDVDHIPAEFGIWTFTDGTPRPYTHALWTVLLLALAAAATRPWSRRHGAGWRAGVPLVLGGAATGVAAHFLRDIATAPMALWWPLTSASVQVSYWWYVLALLLLVGIGRFSVPGRVPRPAAGDPAADSEAAGERRA